MLCHYRNLSNCAHHHEWHQLAKLTKWSRFMPNKTDGKIRRNIVREEHNPFNRCTWTIKIILWMQYKENQNNTLFIRKYSQFYTCSSQWPLLKSLIVINYPFTASWYVKRISIFYLSLLCVNKKSSNDFLDNLPLLTRLTILWQNFYIYLIYAGLV